MECYIINDFMILLTSNKQKDLSSIHNVPVFRNKISDCSGDMDQGSRLSPYVDY